MKRIKKVFALLLVLCMVIGMLPLGMFASATGTGDNSTFYRIFHLDAGRKYFSVDQIKALIDTLAANNYTHMELAIGNDGLRFLLDDMSVTANDTTYTSDAVKAGIQAGNKAYDTSKSYNPGEKEELTQTEMDTIISYAKGKDIEIIPLINTPGHMDAMLYACQALCDANAAYGSSSTTIDVTNAKAVAFTQALVQKYVNYFADKGCKLFNLGADEYAGTSFGALQSAGSYDEFADYVNGVADIIKKAGMKPLAFNDGIYYNGSNYSGNSSINFDTDIVICYWTSGYTGYSPASLEYLQSRGFQNFIHTDESWYYVLGRNNSEWAGYNTAANATKTIAVDRMSVDEVGAMICLWCDTPSASYESNANNVSTLISNLATSNPTYFAADSDPDESVKVTEKTITVTVGQTATDTIEGADYSKNIVETELNKSIATVSAEYKQVTGGTKEVKATSITSGQSYYIKNSNGQYLSSSATWVSNIGSAALWTVSSGGSGYKLKNGNNYLYRQMGGSLGTTTRNSSATSWSFSNGTFSYDGWFGSSPLGDAYTVTTTDPVDATTVTFTGVAVGTTYVTVGNTRYTINVVAEDLSKAPSLTVEYWITNLPVTADGATSKSISAQSAYGEAGVDISTLVPATGTYEYGSVVYWKGTVLDSSNKQTTAGGAENDKTGSGKDFNLIRYWNGSWQYFYEADGTWNTISSTDQVVIYWLQPTEVTKEITTLVKDWGFAPDAQGDNENKVALTVAVVYPDGTVSPAEGDMYSTSTTLFNYWSGRDIGLVAPVNNSDYEIAKITVTDGTRDQSGYGQWGSNDTITWEKVTNEDGSRWYNETTYWDETVGGTPMVNGVTSNITWSNYNTAKLVLIYLKPVHYDTNLIVNWVDDSASGALISTMEVAVSSDGTPINFYNGLKQTSALPTEGVGGTFTLDDNAYVTNSSNVNQTFNKDITTIPGVAAQYKSGLYNYVSAELSADGKTLTLHYNFDNAQLNKQYVVDFGLPVSVKISDLLESTEGMTDVTVSSNAKLNEGKTAFTYQPSAIMGGIETVRVTVTIGGNPKTINVGFVPATTVYYEEGFATLNGFTGGNKGTGTQVTQVAGDSTDEYGYDSAYNTVGASNGTQATSGTKGDSASFTFTGTGVDIYANSTTTTGWLMIQVKNASGTVKLLQVNTAMQNGSTGATEGQKVEGYNIPVASITGLAHGSYTVTITNISTEEGKTTVKLDGFRVYNTLSPTDAAHAEGGVYYKDQEDNPTFIEVRDQVLAGLSVTSTGSGQVYAGGEIPEGTKVAVVASTGEYTQEEIDDLLKNGPKNEIYLQPEQALVLNIKTAREVQLGLKALNAKTTYTINKGDEQTLKTSTDMFYTVLNKGTSGEQTITITNTGDGILSVTKLKVCDDPNATLLPLKEGDLQDALVALGLSSTPGEDEDDETAGTVTLYIEVKAGEETLTTELTAEVGEDGTYTFTAEEIQKAAEALELPEGYTLSDVTYTDVTVSVNDDELKQVSFTAVKAAEEITPPPATDTDTKTDNKGTGDSFSALPWLLAMAVSGAALALVALRKKRTA